MSVLFRRFASTSSKFSLPPTIKQLLALPSQLDRPVTVSGWIKSIRKQKNVSFAVVTDGSSVHGLQAVLLKGTADLSKLTNGAAVRLTGRLVPSPGSGQTHELLVDQNLQGQIVLLGECPPDTYPIQKQHLSPEYLREHPHLRARTSHIAAMIRLRDILSRQINTWFQSLGFCFVNTPVITGNDAEGAGESFRLAPVEGRHPAADNNIAQPPPSEFFSRPAFLTVSHQLHLEAMTASLSRVYTLSPCFRAEKSLTGKHLAEFWMLEAEWAFPINSGIHGICDFTEALLKETIVGLLEIDDVNFLWKGGEEYKRQSLLNAIESRTPWARVSYTEAIRLLRDANSSKSFDYQPEWGQPLQSEHERWLAESFVGGPVFVTDYPSCLKPFYMRMNSDDTTVACFDLLIPYVGELIGGSLREERVKVLENKMKDISGSDWYVDLRKYGGTPHAGFGLGFERLIGWVSGIDNIRECIPIPRWSGRMLL